VADTKPARRLHNPPRGEPGDGRVASAHFLVGGGVWIRVGLRQVGEGDDLLAAYAAGGSRAVAVDPDRVGPRQDPSTEDQLDNPARTLASTQSAPS